MRARSFHTQAFGLPAEFLYRTCWSIPYGKKAPKSSVLFGTEPRTEIVGQWDDNGLCFVFTTTPSLVTPAWPDYTSADCIEICIASRAWKEAKSVHKYCHTFLIFPTMIEGVISREITHLSQVETRPLVSHNEIDVQKVGKELRVYIPFTILHGWTDETSFGFACGVYAQGHGMWWPGDGRAIWDLPTVWAEIVLKK